MSETVVPINDNELTRLLEKAQGLKAKRIELDTEIAACYEEIKRVGEELRAHYDSEKALLSEAQTILSGSSARPVGEREKHDNWRNPPSMRGPQNESVILPRVGADEDGAETLN
jgi:hypothetical protein